MKKFFLLLMPFMIGTSVTSFAAKHVQKMLMTADTPKVTHVIDGLITEWPAASFVADKETSIATAIDNDKDQLFVALKISDMVSITRIMGLGMNLFIDLKGKHKESTTIEFPIKASAAQVMEFVSKFKDGNGKKIDVDDATIKNQFLSRMVIMKTAGLVGLDEEKIYGLINNNGLTVAYSIDENTNTLYIEYAIPFQLLDATIISLTGKKISVGLKLNVPDISAMQQRTVTSTEIVSGGPGGRLSTGRASSLIEPPGSTMSTPRSPIKEIYIWNKYDMKF